MFFGLEKAKPGNSGERNHQLLPALLVLTKDEPRASSQKNCNCEWPEEEGEEEWAEEEEEEWAEEEEEDENGGGELGEQ